MKRFLKKRESMLVIILAVLFIVATIGNPVFLRPDNLMEVLKNASVLGILSCGMLLVVLSGGIDISISAITAVCTCILGYFIKNIMNSIPVVLLVCMVCGGIMGLINGLLISRFVIPSIVATLGTYNVIYGLLRYVMNGTWIIDLPTSFTVDFGTSILFGFRMEELDRVVGLPVQVAFMLLVVFFTWWMLKYTRFGRSVYALGGNREAAERIGINTKKVETMIYTYLGLLAGLAAVIHISIYRNVDPDNFIGNEITVIAATVIGGVSIKGGYGSVFGVLIGVFFLSFVANGLALMRVSSFWKDIVTGLVIIVMVSIEMYSNFMREKNRVKVDVVSLETLRKAAEGK